MREFGEEHFEEIEDQLGFARGNMTSPRCPLSDAGRFYDEYLQGLRAHAILYLLIDADSDGFHHDLQVAAFARRNLLERCAQAGHADMYMRASRTEGFLDPIVAGNLALAREVASLSPVEWGGPQDEYEDDFCYARFLHLWVTRGASAASELDALIARFDRVVAGAEPARLRVCRAFRAGDRAAFGDAFAALLDEREEEVAAAAPLAEQLVIPAINAQVFIEGLAVLRLAEAAGLPTEPEYEGCPALARVPYTGAPPKDPFRGR